MEAIFNLFSESLLSFFLSLLYFLFLYKSLITEVQYRLFRNNTESGPFSKEALLEQGLKTTDQLKIDGDDAWKPASAFPEFKSALEIVSKPKYKFTADKKLVEIKTDKDLSSGKSVPPDNPASVSTTGSSPFKRAPSALPKKKTGNTGKSHSTPVESERANLKSEMREEGAAPLMKHHAVHHIEHAPKMEHRRKPIPKPVKTRHRETNSNFIKEFFLPILIIGGIGCLIWWGYRKFTGSESTTKEPVINSTALTDSNLNGTTEDSQAKAIVPPPGENNASEKAAGATNAKVTNRISDSARRAQIAKKAQDSAANAQLARQKAAQEKAKVAAAEKAKQDDAAKLAAGNSTDTPKTAATTPPADKKTAPPEKKATAPKSTAKPVKKAMGINDYLDMSLNKSPDGKIRNVKIRVHNVSKEDLNIAVIEVRYYDAAGKFIKGETLQTGKIGAGKTETLKVPNSKDADRISYKVSLISGDNVYLMGN